jgi:hypothetical protein
MYLDCWRVRRAAEFCEVGPGSDALYYAPRLRESSRRYVFSRFLIVHNVRSQAP